MERHQQSDRPKLIGPKTRWLVLLAWAVCLAGVLVAQRIAAEIIPTGNWLSEEGTAPTLAEELWHLLSPGLVLLFSVLFFLAAKRLVPEDGTRLMIRAWGVALTVVALLLSLGMGCCFNLIWYMD